MYIYFRKVNIYAKKMQVFPLTYIYNIIYVYYYFVDILCYYIIMLHDINIIHTCK